MTHQLSLLDAPSIVDSTPIVPAPKPTPPPQITVGALVVPKAREEFIPLFVDQVCQVTRLGQSLGRDRVWAVPVKWMGRSVLAAPFGEEDLMILVGGKSDATD